MVRYFILSVGLLLPQQVFAESELKLEVLPKFGGYYRIGEWVTLVVDLENRGESLETELVVDIDGRSIAMPITLPSPSRKQVELVVPVNGWQREFQVRLLGGDDSGNVQTVALHPLPASARVFASVGELRAIPFDVDRAHVVFIDRRDLPETWYGYRMFDGVGLTSSETADLTATQLEALERWLMLGGQLVVSGEGVSGFVRTRLDATPDSTESETARLSFGMGSIRLTRNLERVLPASDPAAPTASAVATTLLASDRATPVRGQRDGAPSRIAGKLGMLFSLYGIVVLAGWILAGRVFRAPLWSHAVPVGVATIACVVVGLSFADAQLQEQSMVHVFGDVGEAFVSSHSRLESSGRGTYRLEATSSEGWIEIQGEPDDNPELSLRPAKREVDLHLGQTRDLFVAGFVRKEFDVAQVGSGAGTLTNRSPFDLGPCRLISEGRASSLAGIPAGSSLELRKTQESPSALPPLLEHAQSRYERLSARNSRHDVVLCHTEQFRPSLLGKTDSITHDGSAVVIFHLGVALAAFGNGQGQLMIRTDRLSKTYGASSGLDAIDLSVGTGRALGLVGTNASGRTTLLDLLSTLVRPTSGSASVAGHDIIAEPLEVRRRIGYVRQSVSFHDPLTVGEYLEFVAGSRDGAGRGIARRIPQVLEQCDLRADWSIGGMTRGLRQRLAIASAVLPDPAVLLLDHPCNHLDPVARQRSLAVFAELRRCGATLIIADDSCSALQTLCDEVAFMHRGSLLDLLTIDELDQEPSVTLSRLIAQHGRSRESVAAGSSGQGVGA